MLHLLPFLRDGFTHSRLYPCPACNETISADVSACRFCHLTIDASTAQRLQHESQEVITAIRQAKAYSFSKPLAVLLAGFAFLSLYMDLGGTKSLVLCSLVFLAYGALWLGGNRSRATRDADYPAAITTVKQTIMVWVAVLLVQLSASVILNGSWRRIAVRLPQSLAYKIIDEGNNRPVLSIAGVKVIYFPSFKSENPRKFPILVVKFKNNGKTTARLTRATLKSYSPSSGCDLTLKEGTVTNIVIPPGYEAEALFSCKVEMPCKTAGLLKLNVVYTNLASGLEYTQEVPVSVDLVFGDQSSQ